MDVRQNSIYVVFENILQYVTQHGGTGIIYEFPSYFACEEGGVNRREIVESGHQTLREVYKISVSVKFYTGERQCVLSLIRETEFVKKD